MCIQETKVFTNIVSDVCAVSNEGTALQFPSRVLTFRVTKLILKYGQRVGSLAMDAEPELDVLKSP